MNFGIFCPDPGDNRCVRFFMLKTCRGDHLVVMVAMGNHINTPCCFSNRIKIFHPHWNVFLCSTEIWCVLYFYHSVFFHDTARGIWIAWGWFVCCKKLGWWFVLDVTPLGPRRSCCSWRSGVHTSQPLLFQKMHSLRRVAVSAQHNKCFRL